MNTFDAPPPNPFPGLRPFRGDENHLFFGREDQTVALLRLLRTKRFLAVVGTSGSGKSSLVRAGMIAGLHGGAMSRAGSTWEVLILRPGGSPVENLVRALVEAGLYDADDAEAPPRLLATLNRSRFGLVEAIKQSDVLEPGANVLVVVDQFEELFRFRRQGVESEETAAAFVNLLLTAADQAECPIYATITMRSDYLGDCSEIPGLAEAVNEGEYLIPRLWNLQALGMAEYRAGDAAAAEKTLLAAAAKAGGTNPYVTGTAAFFRAMCLFRQGKQAEARKLVAETAANLKPPADQSPLAAAVMHNDLILWLARKEAKDMIK